MHISLCGSAMEVGTFERVVEEDITAVEPDEADEMFHQQPGSDRKKIQRRGRGRSGRVLPGDMELQCDGLMTHTGRGLLHLPDPPRAVNGFSQGPWPWRWWSCADWTQTQTCLWRNIILYRTGHLKPRSLFEYYFSENPVVPRWRRGFFNLTPQATPHQKQHSYPPVRGAC
jgi:hypothetical protein